MATALDWQPDSLAGYQQQVFELGRDPDGEGEVAAVLVRRQPRADEAVHGAVLYVHGFSDYFFQTELADFFAAPGLAFYESVGRSQYRLAGSHHLAHEFQLEHVYQTLADAFPEAIRALNHFSEHLVFLGTDPLPGLDSGGPN